MNRRLILAPIALLFLLPSFALSATPPAGDDFWIGKGDSAIYGKNSSLQSSAAEVLPMSCVDSEGRPISADDRILLSQIALAAADIYQGKFEFGGGSSLLPAGGAVPPPPNGGYSEGRSGMNMFLSKEQQLLASGQWVPYSSRALVLEDGESKKDASYGSGSPGWSVSLGAAVSSVPSERGSAVASLFDPDAAHYLLVTAPLPESCGLMQAEPLKPTLQTQLQEPGDFLLDQMLYVPGKIAGETMTFLQPHAWNFTFYTPHSERGDMMWSTPAACSASSQDLVSSEQIRRECAASEDQNWTAAVSGQKQDTPWFVGAARFLQWLVSGAYLLIILASAVVFIIRGNRESSANIVKLVPRIILSALVTIFAGLAISALVSLSNILVGAIFSFSSTSTVGSLSSILLQTEALVGGSDLIGRIVSLGVALSSAFFYLVFVVASLARQVMLVACVVLAPLAAMCLIVPRWRAGLFLYLRLLALVVALPVVLALILKIGVSINPLQVDPLEAAGTAEGILGLLLAVVTMWMMYKAIRMSLEVARGGWKALVPAEAQGSALSAGDTAKEIAKSMDSGALLPSERSATPPAGLAPLEGSPSQGALPTSPKKDQEKEGPVKGVSRFIQVRKRASRKRISAEDARKYRSALLSHLQDVQDKSGGKMSRAELRRAKEEWEKKNGGKLHQSKGSWHLGG